MFNRPSYLSKRLSRLFAHEFTYAPWGNDMWKHSTDDTTSSSTCIMLHLPSGYDFRLYKGNKLATIYCDSKYIRLPKADRIQLAKGLRKLMGRYYAHQNKCSDSNFNYETKMNLRHMRECMLGHTPWQ